MVTVVPGGTLTIRYDGPLTADQAGSMRQHLAGALPGVEIIVVLVGQPPPAETGQARDLLLEAGVHPELAAEITAAVTGTGADPVAFARYFQAVAASLRRDDTVPS